MAAIVVLGLLGACLADVCAGDAVENHGGIGWVTAAALYGGTKLAEMAPEEFRLSAPSEESPLPTSRRGVGLQEAEDRQVARWALRDEHLAPNAHYIIADRFLDVSKGSGQGRPSCATKVRHPPVIYHRGHGAETGFKLA